MKRLCVDMSIVLGILLLYAVITAAVIYSTGCSAPAPQPEPPQFATEYLNGYFMALDQFYKTEPPSHMDKLEYELQRKMEIVRIMQQMHYVDVEGGYVDGYHTAIEDIVNEKVCPYNTYK